MRSTVACTWIDPGFHRLLKVTPRCSASRRFFSGTEAYFRHVDHPLPGVTIYDTAFSYTFGPGLGLQDLTVAMNVTNLSNRRYAIHASAPRQAFIALGAGF